MRIRRGRLARGNNASSASAASDPHMDPEMDPDMDIRQQLELVSSSRGRRHVAEASDCGGMESKAPLALLEKLQISSTHRAVFIPSPRPYMNLDEFVTSLARKNCFPEDDDQEGITNSDPLNVTTGESSSLINFSVQTVTDDDSRHFGRLFGSGGSSESAEGALRGDVAAVEPSLRLAMSSVSAHSHKQPANPRTTTTTSVELEPTEQEMEAAAQADQTMKSSTESTETSEEKGWSGRHTRLSSSTGIKRGRLPPLPAGFHDEQTDDNTAQDDAGESSDVSVQQQTDTRGAKRKRTQPLVSVSSSTLAMNIPHGSEKRKPKLGQRGKASAKQRASSSSRSGRPKKLKYLKQENVEELGNQCNRRDGKGWTCPLLAKPGYQLCDHHLDKLRCKPGSRSKYNKTNKKVA